MTRRRNTDGMIKMASGPPRQPSGWSSAAPARTPGTTMRTPPGQRSALLSARGDPALFGMAVFLTALLALKVVFHKTLFRWRHWAARNPEPTEEYLALERVGWVVFAIVIAVVYVISVTEIC